MEIVGRLASHEMTALLVKRYDFSARSKMAPYVRLLSGKCVGSANLAYMIAGFIPRQFEPANIIQVIQSSKFVPLIYPSASTNSSTFIQDSQNGVPVPLDDDGPMTLVVGWNLDTATYVRFTWQVSFRPVERGDPC